MAEVVEAAIEEVERVEEGLVHELLERLVEGADRPVEEPGGDLRDEAAADDGAGPRDGLGVAGQAGVPREHRVLDRLRDVRLADRPPVGPLRVAQRREELLDVERDAVRPREHRADHLARRRQARPEDERRHERRLVVGERRQADLLGEPLAEQPGPPLAMDRPGRELAQPVATEDEERPVGGASRQLPDDLEAELVRPLQVVEGEQRRTVDGLEDPVRDLVDEHAAVAEGIGPAVALEGEQVGAQRPEVIRRAHAAGHVEDRRQRHLAVVRAERADADVEPEGLRLADDRPHEPRLADARLAREQDAHAPAGGGLGELAIGEPERLVAPDEERALDGTRGPHGAECRTAAAEVIGHSTHALKTGAPPVPSRP